jgi:1,2-diacylglycerol 3-alpha-glucosyltransferase
MNILMISNTFSPHVGGVARSLERFTEEYRRLGHRTIVVAPEFEKMPENEEDVIRVPAIQNFNGSDFSVRLPIPGLVLAALEDFKPDIIHAHHPFLLGDTALVLSASQNVPLVFTHHTMYEQYTHYVPGDSPAMQRFVIELSTGFANLCDRVFAPSESIAEVLKNRHVITPIEVVPTGVQVEHFSRGDGTRFRKKLNLPKNAWVVGHLGRLAPEKNLEFLARAVGEFCRTNENAHFLLIGTGPSEKIVKDLFDQQGLSNRLHSLGILKGQDVVDAYHAMDVFAFASQSETQGMVLTEAMAAGLPVVAIDAPGVREVVKDKQNGRLLPTENIDEFVEALGWVASLSEAPLKTMKKNIQLTAESYSIQRCVTKALSIYESLLTKKPGPRDRENSMWDKAIRMLETEWEIWVNRAHAAGAALKNTEPNPPRPK